MEEWLPIVERLGLPTFLAIFLLIFGLKYIIKPLIDSHTALVKNIETSNQTNEKNLAEITLFLKQHIEVEGRRIGNLETGVRIIGESLDRHLKYHDRMEK